MQLTLRYLKWYGIIATVKSFLAAVTHFNHK